MNKLILEIEGAWEDVKYPGDENIFIPDSYDDEDITEYFSGTTWRKHSVEELRNHCSAISTFFTAKAWHYWLPAYLIAAVNDPDELSQGLDAITISLNTEEKGFKDKFDLLDYAQTEALVQFYEYVANELMKGDPFLYQSKEWKLLEFLYGKVKNS